MIGRSTDTPPKVGEVGHDWGSTPYTSNFPNDGGLPQRGVGRAVGSAECGRSSGCDLRHNYDDRVGLQSVVALPVA